MSVFNLAQKRSFPPLCAGYSLDCGLIPRHLHKQTNKQTNTKSKIQHTFLFQARVTIPAIEAENKTLLAVPINHNNTCIKTELKTEEASDEIGMAVDFKIVEMDEILNCSDSDKFDPLSNVSTKKRKLDDYIGKENSDENTFKKKYFNRPTHNKKINELVEDIEVQCYYCSETMLRSVVTEHMKTSHGCYIVKNTYNKKYLNRPIHSWKNEVTDIDIEVQCYYCSEMMMKSVVKEHMKTSHGRCVVKMFGEKRQFQCPDCHAALLKDVTINHVCFTEPPLKKGGMSSVNVQCSQCTKTCISLKRLELHMKTRHSNEQPFASKWPFSRLDLLESLRQKDIHPANRQFTENVRTIIIEKFKIQPHKLSDDQQSELFQFCKCFTSAVRSKWVKCKKNRDAMYEKYQTFFDIHVTLKTIKKANNVQFRSKKRCSRTSCTRFGYLNKHKKKIQNQIIPFVRLKSSSSR
jgi:hypothetical protein